MFIFLYYLLLPVVFVFRYLSLVVPFYLVLLIVEIGILFVIPIFLSLKRGRKAYLKLGNRSKAITVCVGFFLLFYLIFERILSYILPTIGFLTFGDGEIPNFGKISEISFKIYSFFSGWISIFVLIATLILVFLAHRKISRIEEKGENLQTDIVPTSTDKYRFFGSKTLVAILGLIVVVSGMSQDTLSALAHSTNAPLVCYLKSYRPTKRFHIETNDCLGELAVKNKKTSICNYIFDNELQAKDKCYADSSQTQSNASGCELLDSGIKKATCYYDFAIKNNDYSSCSPILKIKGSDYENHYIPDWQGSNMQQYGKCVLNFPTNQYDQQTCNNLFTKSLTGEGYNCLNSENINRRDSNGNTILMYYVISSGAGYYDYWTKPQNSLYPKILSYKPDVNIQNNNGETVLHLWLRAYLKSITGSTDLLKTVLANGAKTDVQDKNGQTPENILDQSSQSSSFKDGIRKIIFPTQTKSSASSALPQGYSVSLKINNSHNPPSMKYGSSFALSWSASSAKGCRLSYELKTENNSYYPILQEERVSLTGQKNLIAETEDAAYVPTLIARIACYSQKEFINEVSDQITVSLTK